MLQLDSRAIVEEALAYALARESLKHPKHSDVLLPLRKRLERILRRRWNHQQRAFLAEARHWLGRIAAGRHEADAALKARLQASVTAKINAGTALSQPPGRNDTNGYNAAIEDAATGALENLSVEIPISSGIPFEKMRVTNKRDALEGVGGGVGPGMNVFDVPIDQIVPSEDITKMLDKMADVKKYADMIKQGSEPPALYGRYDPETGEVTVYGNRRLLAAKMAGADSLPVAIPGKIAETAAELGAKFADQYLREKSFHQLAADIDATTRDRMANAVADTFASGGTLNDAVSAIKNAFSDMKESRAVTIAQTELADAYNQAMLSSAQEAGDELLKVWNLDGEACEICQDNEADGAIDLDDDFSSGDDAPPAHPNCDCSIGFVRASEE